MLINRLESINYPVTGYFGNFDETKSSTAPICKKAVGNGPFIEFFQALLVKCVQKIELVLESLDIYPFDRVGRNNDKLVVRFSDREDRHGVLMTFTGFLRTTLTVLHDVFQHLDHHKQNSFISSHLNTYGMDSLLKGMYQLPNCLVLNDAFKV